MKAPSGLVGTVVFDLDGTLLDIRQRHHACYRAILAEAGLPALDAAAYWRMKRRRAEQSRILERTGGESFEEVFRSRWERRIEAADLLALDRVQPGARAVLDRLRRKGVTVLLATMRRNRAATLRQLRAHSLDGRFDGIVTCAASAGGRGKAAAVRSAAPALLPGETAWVGDTEADAEAAAALGCRLVLVACGIRSAAFLRGLHAGPVVFGPRALPHWLG